MELLTFFIWLAVFFFGFKIVIGYLVDSAESEIAQRKLLEQADQLIRIVKLEPLPEQGTILAYDGENNQFLGQGHNESEVKDNIMKRFPEKIFVLNDRPFTANKKVEVKIASTKTS